MTRYEKSLLLQDLCSRLPYGIMCHINGDETNTPRKLNRIEVDKLDGVLLDFYENGKDYQMYLSEVKPYLRPMSSMTEEEKEDLLIMLLGKDGTKYFQVLSDGSIDNNDAVHQDLSNFNIHWINFDGVNTSAYIDWLNAHHFDYRGLIPKGLVIEVTKENNPYEN